MTPSPDGFKYKLSMEITARELAEMGTMANVRDLVVNGLADVVKETLAATYTPGVLDEIIREAHGRFLWRQRR